MEWKHTVNMYWGAAIVLAIIIPLYGFVASPDFEIKAFEQTLSKPIQLKDLQAQVIPEKEEEEEEEEEQEMLEVANTNVKFADDFGEDTDISEIPKISRGQKTTFEALKDEDLETDTEREPTKKFVIFDEAPVAFKAPAPDYPELLRQQNLTGHVILNMEVLEDGSVGYIEVENSTHPAFNDEAIKAAKKWRFQPAKTGGKPVACWVKQKFTFTL